MDMSGETRCEASSGDAIRAQATDGDRWRELVHCVGAEIAMPLTATLDRIQALTATGRIDTAGVRALRDEVERARRAGMVAQQLARLASSRLRQSHERLALGETLQAVLQHRAGDTAIRGVIVKQSPLPADVILDASLLFGLLDSTLDWALLHARSEIGFAVEVKDWSSHARLICLFEPHTDHGTNASAPNLDSLAWRLVEQTAWAMGLLVTRTVKRDEVALTIEFPRAGHEGAEASIGTDADEHFAPSSTNSRPLAGCHVLVVASRRELRLRIRDAIRHMGLVIDLVPSVDEAVDFCRESLPHAIITEAVLGTQRLRMLREHMAARMPEFAFIEIIEEGASFAVSGFDATFTARVGRDAIESALPSVLTFELSRTL